MTLWKWSRTAATNATADGTINWQEGQTPSSVNDSARALMAAVAKARDDLSGQIAAGGTATAYSVTSYQNFTSLQDGLQVAFRVTASNSTADVTLSVDGLAAKPIRLGGASSATKPSVGFFRLGGIYTVTYQGTDQVWLVNDAFVETPEFENGTRMVFQQTAAPTGWTKDTTHNNKALRLTTGSVTTGGSMAFTSAFASRTPSGSVQSTTLSAAAMPVHDHSMSRGGNSQSCAVDAGGVGVAGTSSTSTGNAGGGGAHLHGLTMNPLDFSVQYVDFIIAEKD